MSRTLTKRQLTLMRTTYLRTNSVTAAAKAVGCDRKTVASYRDKLNWTTETEKAEPHPVTLLKPSNLTNDLAIKMATMWRLNMEDVKIAEILNIPHGTLKNWIWENRQATIIRSVTKVDSQGKAEGTERKVETIGLRDLRARERANLELSYLQKLDLTIQKAYDEGDWKTVVKAATWMLSKMCRDKFGGSDSGRGDVNVSVNTATQNNNVELNLDEVLDRIPAKVRRQLLSEMEQGDILNETDFSS